MVQDLINSQISVALCTYNGEEYLKEQLQSIAGQSIKPLEIVVCDDGSLDGTVEAVKAFARQAPVAVRLFEAKEEGPLGVNANFSRAISLCQGKYIALSDQDDTWASDRLFYSLAEIKKIEEDAGKSKPCLVHSDLKVTDQDGTVLADSFMRRQGISHVTGEPLKRLLAHNFVTGSTVLLNKALVKVALPIPEEAVHHDWWLALVAAGSGNIGFLPRGLVCYRQHGKNVVGSKGYYSPGNIKRLGRLEKLEERVAATVRQGLALQERLEGISGAAMPKYAKEYLQAAGRSGREACQMAYKHNIGQSGFLRNLLFQMFLLMGRYRRYI